jgi:hypothetical protein
MAIEQGLFQLITQVPSIQNAVGVDANGVTRAYWVLAPQGTKLPYLIFGRVATTDSYAMSGPIGFRAGLFQVVCYSNTFYGSRDIANTVRKFLQSYTGTLPDTDATIVDAVMIEKDWDDRYEEGSTGFIYGAYLQFRIWYYG